MSEETTKTCSCGKEMVIERMFYNGEIDDYWICKTCSKKVKVTSSFISISDIQGLTYAIWIIASVQVITLVIMILQLL